MRSKPSLNPEIITKLMNKSPTARCQSQVRTTRYTNLVLLVSPVPHTASALRNRNQLVGDPVCQLRITPLLRRINDPFDRGTAALAQVQRVGNLHGSTTASDTLLLANTEQRSHRVNNQCEVEDRVEGQLRGGRTANKRATRVGVGRRCGAKVIQDNRHVLEAERLDRRFRKEVSREKD